jgi:hypothetical protein
MPTAVEEPVVVESEEEQKLVNARNPYDGLVHMDGKTFFWDAMAKGKSVEVGGVNSWAQKK